jgi:hypothetical protein
MKVKRIPIIQDGLDVNDYRGDLSEVLDLPEEEAKHLIEIGRAKAIKPKRRKK